MTYTQGGDAVGRRMALAREWEDLVSQVRDLEGFEDFLRPPRLQRLLPAAQQGPVVIVNVSRWRCDALIVRRDGVTTRALPDLTLDEATARANAYLSTLSEAEQADARHLATQAAEPGETARDAGRRHLLAARDLEAAHQRVDTMLTDLQSWMWQTIAEPVLAELGYTETPTDDASTWPRVWWCPTGPLTILPLHTAGIHSSRDKGRAVLDRVVSSYTPTLRALLESRSSGDEEGTEGEERDRLLFVDVPDLPDLAPIDNAAERAALLRAFPEHRRRVLNTAEATTETVHAALAQHRWVHFSCHGDQDLANPSQGGLRLCDGTLTVAAITTGRFHGDFAGLSACKTAVGGVHVLDEVITLAAALHYTGYRHVIAALWSVDSQTSAEVFSSLYSMIAADGRLFPDRAPAVLHTIVRRLRDREPEWPHRWAPFAHMGP